jgi:ketohexokinase
MTPSDSSTAATAPAEAASTGDPAGGWARAVLGVGIATQDLINLVERYPAEDDEVRALMQHRLRGGNCANTLAVLRQLGHRCAWAGSLADDGGGAAIEADLAARGIDCSGAARIPGGATPTSYITLSRANGSRTIIHHRDLREFAAEDFARIDLGGLDWLHFEGRAPAETARMIARAAEARPQLPISVEIEKPRPGIEQLFRLPRGAGSVLIFARAFAESQGAGDALGFLRRQAALCEADLLVLPWGADGAYALPAGGEPVHVPAHRPPRVADTLAAGDVFNAAVIDARLRALGAEALLRRANRLAGHACGQQGIEGVVTSARGCGLL